MYAIKVQNFVLRNEPSYQNAPVLKYSIEYPQFSSDRSMFFLNKLNRYYYDKAHVLAKYCESAFYREAVEYYKETLKNNYPFHMYELQVVYTVTYNHDGILSLYFDEGRYTGGANGTSQRSSDSWEVYRGRRIELGELYPSDESYPIAIKSEIKRRIADEIKNKDGNYFENYQVLVEENFSDKNFYLNPKTLAFYFQEITIAPHSSATVVFELPYVSGPLKPEVAIRY